MTIRALCMRIARMLPVLGAAGALACGAFAGCSSPNAEARTDAIGPDATQFAYVAPVLVRRCGSIDCHGSRYRNMRIYGYGGQRLGPNAKTPDSPKSVTAEEQAATYDSVVGLEPEIMRDVVQSGGAGPERLTFVRKGRGEEDHKGNQRITKGDNSDRCITSWLANNVDKAACDLAGCIDVSDGGVRSIGTCL